MDRLQEIQDELFLDIQNIIEELNEVSSLEELFEKEKLVRELSEKTNFLKLSEAFGLSLILEKASAKEFSIEDKQQVILTIDPIEKQLAEKEMDLNDNQILAEAQREEYIGRLQDDVEEEMVDSDDDALQLSDNEMLKEESEEDYSSDKISEQENVESEPEIEVKISEPEAFLNNESQFSFAIDSSNDTTEAKDAESTILEETSIISASENFDTEDHSSQHSIEINLQPEAISSDSFDNIDVEEIKETTPISEITESQQKLKNEEDIANSKKIKLANIKGVNKSLFDEETLEKIKLEHNTNDEVADHKFSSSNLANPKQTTTTNKDFRLDLNDKLAFTQNLFENSQVELNQVVTKLNEFTNLDDAKEYLSDLYYHKNWEKVDSYAQRLWVLVENKFL